MKVKFFIRFVFTVFLIGCSKNENVKLLEVSTLRKYSNNWMWVLDPAYDYGDFDISFLDKKDYADPVPLRKSVQDFINNNPESDFQKSFISDVNLNKPYKDFWGSDYLFFYKTESWDNDFFSEYEEGTLFLWSIGKNKKNEFGLGDDILIFKH